MTFALTTLGPNSKKLAYTFNETPVTVMAQMRSILPTMGWTLHDSSDAQYNVFSVFKAPIAGTSNYKYMKLSYPGPGSTYITIDIYESWNASTHSGTNTAVQYNFSLDTIADSEIYIFANSRYCLFLSKTNGIGGYGYANNGAFVGCVEFTEDRETLGAYPNFLIISSNCGMGSSQYYPALGPTTPASNSWFKYFGTCRNTTNQTSMDNPNVLLTSAGRPFIDYVSITCSPSGTLSAWDSSNVKIANSIGTNTSIFIPFNKTLKDLLPSGDNPVTGRPYCFTPLVGEFITNSIAYKTTRGKMYGLKIAGYGKNWNMLDTVTLSIDSNQFMANVGVDTTHLYIGNNFIIPL